MVKDIKSPGHSHRLERKVFFLIVDQPGWTLGDVVEADGEQDEEDAGDEAEPVPGEGATHDVTADDAKSGHHLREGTADVPQLRLGGLVDVDGGDGDLEAGTQPEQEPAHVELPGLAGRHHHRPPDEQAHDGECQQRGFPSHGVHQENCAQ